MIFLIFFLVDFPKSNFEEEWTVCDPYHKNGCVTAQACVETLSKRLGVRELYGFTNWVRLTSDSGYTKNLVDLQISNFAKNKPFFSSVYKYDFNQVEKVVNSGYPCVIFIQGYMETWRAKNCATTVILVKTDDCEATIIDPFDKSKGFQYVDKAKLAESYDIDKWVIWVFREENEKVLKNLLEKP